MSSPPSSLPEMPSAVPRAAGALLAAATLLAADPARACSVCGCGDPLLPAGAAPGAAGELVLALETEALSVTAGDDLVPGALDALDQETIRAVAVYAPTERLNLVLFVPFVWKDELTTGAGLPPTRSSTSGLGDVEVAARWFPWSSVDFGKQRRQTLSLVAGSSLPTGQNDVTRDGVRLDEHVQPGTGSFGPYLGAAWRLQQDPWNALVSVSARAHTLNAYGYRYGGALLWTAEVQWAPHPRLAFSAGIDGRWAAADALDGVAVDSTGGLVLAAAPGAMWNVAGDLWLTARAQLPVYTRLLGTQSVGPTVLASLQFRLP